MVLVLKLSFGGCFEYVKVDFDLVGVEKFVGV